MRFGTMFSGGEGVGVGLSAAGLTHAWGVEYEADIAGVARMNGFDLIVDDVRNVDYSALPRVEWLHASPVCTRASNANPGAEESADDVEMAQAVVRALEAQQPQVFSLENVWMYRTFESFKRICAALNDLGYMWDFEHVNAADFGVPQTRKRLILRAVRLGLLPPLPAPVRWVGWYEAIADLLPELPESQLAPWQVARLPEELRTMLFSSNGNSGEFGVITCAQGEGRFTLRAGRSAEHRALLLNGTNAGRELSALSDSEPSFTITGEVHKGMPRAWISSRVVSVTPRALARFQSFPDSYKLPDKRTLAAKVIGNAVPPKLMQGIAEGLIGGGAL